MNTLELANKLVEMCKAHQWIEAINDLYAEDIVSVEAMSMGGGPTEFQGIEAVRGKSQWWVENHDIHHIGVEGPFVARDTFAVRFEMDVTNKASGQRFQGAEVGIYTARDGKVAREEFLPLRAE